MKLDRDLARAIKKEANGDGSREAKIAFLKRARAARKMLSTPSIAREGVFDGVVKECGRVPVAICLAVTIWARRDRLDDDSIKWSRAVLDIWKNRPGDLFDVYISDELHPTSIERYAGSFIRCTTEEA